MLYSSTFIPILHWNFHHINYLPSTWSEWWWVRKITNFLGKAVTIFSSWNVSIKMVDNQRKFKIWSENQKDIKRKFRLFTQRMTTKKSCFRDETIAEKISYLNVQSRNAPWIYYQCITLSNKTVILAATCSTRWNDNQVCSLKWFLCSACHGYELYTRRILLKGFEIITLGTNWWKAKGIWTLTIP